METTGARIATNEARDAGAIERLNNLVENHIHRLRELRIRLNEHADRIQSGPSGPETPGRPVPAPEAVVPASIDGIFQRLNTLENELGDLSDAIARFNGL